MGPAHPLFRTHIIDMEDQMTAEIPETHEALLTGPIPATIATLMPDGQPQLTIVWLDYDGTHLLFTTARGRQKEKNLEARPQATVMVLDPQDAYHWIEVRGQVAEMTEAGAVEHIDAMTRVYTDHDQYYGGAAPAERAAQETRVLIKIRPTKVNIT